MKQTIFMVLLTTYGALGAFVIEPFVGVAVYYLFAVLRPQYMWQWALPEVGWSAYVAWSTLLATVWWAMSRPPSPDERSEQRLSFAHKAFFVFGAWICLTYFTAQHPDVAWQWFLEYIKIFLMFAVASFVLTNVKQVWWIYRLSAGALIYIAYELNYLYIFDHRLDIYHTGYGGLDNNGAGLMIAMGVPLAVHAWEGTKQWWRWGYLLAVPPLMHAVLMSYSRGAMVALIVAAPLMLFRSKKKKQFSLILVLLISTVPYLAGQEIRARFFTVENYDADATANTRFDSWQAAIRIANDYPVFGVGIRNSNVMSYAYGADMEGRTIHSQYLQTLADSGYPALALYLLALGSTWFSMRKARRALKGRDGTDAALARSMLNGVEGSMAVFCVGAIFLSLEVFELPYILALIGVQGSVLVHRLEVPATVTVRQQQPLSPYAAALRPHISR